MRSEKATLGYTRCCYDTKVKFNLEKEILIMIHKILRNNSTTLENTFPFSDSFLTVAKL